MALQLPFLRSMAPLYFLSAATPARVIWLNCRLETDHFEACLKFLLMNLFELSSLFVFKMKLSMSVSPLSAIQEFILGFTRTNKFHYGSML